MKKSKLNKKKCQQILATLVMGMNFINTIAPMAEAAQKIPESTEHLTQIPTSEAKPLEYTVLPQALKFVDNLIFGRAEAGPITVTGNISVSDRTRPSGKDLESRNKDLKLNPSIQFYILTHPISYGDTFPYKINYTNW